MIAIGIENELAQRCVDLKTPTAMTTYWTVQETRNNDDIAAYLVADA